MYLLEVRKEYINMLFEGGPLQMANETDKPSIDDISLEDPKPVKKSGASPVVVLVLVILIAAVAFFAYMSYVKRENERVAAEARAKAAAAREAQLQAAEGNIAEAITQAEQGNMEAAIAKLQVAENQIGLIITTANTDGDAQAAEQMFGKKQALIDARKAIEAEQVRFQEAVKLQLEGLRSHFNVSVSAPAAPATEAPAAPAEGASVAPAPDAAAPTPDAAAPVAPAPDTAAPVAPAPEAALPAAPVVPVAP